MLAYLALYIILNVIIFLLADVDEYHSIIFNQELSIIIPLEDNIEGALRTLKSVSKQVGIETHVILAVNGKKAKTTAVKLKRYIMALPKVEVTTCYERGKAHAINTALKQVRTVWFGVIDSDCELDQCDALSMLCNCISDKTIAVGGRLKPRRDWRIVTWIQDLEYKRTFLHRRQVNRDLKCVTLISGAFGLFRKDIVEKAGGYCESFVGEDMDIVLSIQRYCCREHIKFNIKYEPRAVCVTNVPRSVHRLFRQRDRWQRGLIGSIIRNITFRFDKGFTMRFIAMPYILAYDVMGPVVWGISLFQEIKALLMIELPIIRELQAWRVLFAAYMATELALDLLTELERSELDHERIRLPVIIGVILLQIPKVLLFMFVIMPARLYGMVTYPWRKKVW